MDVAVVDCSALAAVVFGEDWAAELLPRLRDRRLIAPPLLPFELAQVCAVKIKRYPSQETVLLDQFVAALSAATVALEPVGLDELPQLAGRFDLSCYDAAYLWLALANRAALLTFDAKLAEAYAKATEK
jgi:predicted nucleic acid-binding protein